MSEPLKIEIELIEAIPEIQLIQMLMDVSKHFDDQLEVDEKERAIDYFYKWHKQTKS